MMTDATAPAPSRAASLLWLYAPLFFQTLLLTPLMTGTGSWIFALILACWMVGLFSGRLSTTHRWHLLCLTALLLAVAAPFWYPHWLGNVDCPHCFEAEWRFLALDNATLAPWVLWGLFVLALAVGTQMPHPRWRWVLCRKEQGEIPLLPLLLLGAVLLLPLLLAGMIFWGLISPVPDYGG